jgi:hypothetical protein
MMRRTPLKPGSGFKPRTVPMATTGILRVTAAQRNAPAVKATLKLKRSKMTPIRTSANGEQCVTDCSYAVAGRRMLTLQTTCAGRR